MKKWYYIPLVSLIAALVLEILPYGAGAKSYYQNATTNSTEIIIHTYSYFSYPYVRIIPFPIIAAVLTVITTIFLTALLFVRNPSLKLYRVAIVCCVIAAIASIIQLLVLSTIIGVIISTLLFVTAIILLIGNRQLSMRGDR